MKLSQVITRSSLAAVALLNLSIATSAIAEPIVVTRGPNGAAHVVKSNAVPHDAQKAPMTEARQFPQTVQKGPGGAVHIVTKAKSSAQASSTPIKQARLIQRGPNGAFFVAK